MTLAGHWPTTPAELVATDAEYLALAAAHELAEVLHGFGSAQEQAASDAIDAYLGINTLGGDAA